MYTLFRSCDSLVNVKGIVKKVYITRYELNAKALIDKIYAKNAFIKGRNSTNSSYRNSNSNKKNNIDCKMNNNRKLASYILKDNIKT